MEINNKHLNQLIKIINHKTKDINNINELKDLLIKDLETNDKKYQKNINWFILSVYKANHEIDIIKALDIFEKELLENDIDLFCFQLERKDFPQHKNYNEFANKFCDLSLKNLNNKSNENTKKLEKLILDIHKKYGVLDSQEDFVFESLKNPPYDQKHIILKIKTNDLESNNLKEKHPHLFKSIFDLIYKYKEICKNNRIEINNKIIRISDFQVRIGLEIPDFKS